MIAREIEKIIVEASNSPIWQAKKGVGSFLTFDMGEKVPRKRKSGEVYQTGSIHLWIYLCDWVILENGLDIARSDSDEKDISGVVKLFSGERLTSIRNLDMNTVEMDFTKNLSIRLSGNDNCYDLQDDFFMLYTPSGNISYNKDSGFTSEVPGSED